MSKAKKFTTDYSIAEESHKESERYKAVVAEMMKHGMKQPYIDNILIEQFAAGWNRRGEINRP